MTEADAPEEPERIIQYSPYHPPRETFGEGTWRVLSRHVQKDYPLTWEWVPKPDPDVPPETPPVPGTMTAADRERGYVIVPPGKKLNLPVIKDIGIAPWQKDDD
jgi:hypothetical protein